MGVNRRQILTGGMNMAKDCISCENLRVLAKKTGKPLPGVPTIYDSI
jgi:hypothetical protein